MSRLRETLGRPDLPAVLSIIVIVAGLVAAVLLGNAVGGAARNDSDPSPSGRPAPTPSTAARVVPGGAGWQPVAWSPDGSALLVRKGEGFGLVEGTAGPVAIEGAAIAGWWPGEGRVLTLALGGATANRLVLRTVGQEDRIVVERPGISAVAWSADGQSWAVTADDGLLTGLLDGEPTELAADHPQAISITPAGDRLAFTLGDVRGGNFGELVVLDTVRDERLSVPGVLLGPDDAIAWSPTGRFLAFTGRQGAESGLFLLRPGSQEPVLIAPDADPGSIHWSAEGSWLAAARLADTTPVVQLLAVEVSGEAVGVNGLGSGRSSGFGPLPGMLTTVDAAGRVVAHPLPPGEPWILATDADAACPVAATRAGGSVGYCSVDGELRVIAVDAGG